MKSPIIETTFANEPSTTFEDDCNLDTYNANTEPENNFSEFNKIRTMFQ